MKIPDKIREKIEKKEKILQKLDSWIKTSLLLFVVSLLSLIALPIIFVHLFLGSVLFKILIIVLFVSLVSLIILGIISSKHNLTLKETIITNLTEIEKSISEGNLKKGLRKAYSNIFTKYQDSQISNNGFKTIYFIQRFTVMVLENLKSYSQKDFDIYTKEKLKKFVDESLKEVIQEKFKERMEEEGKKKVYWFNRILKTLNKRWFHIVLLVILSALIDLVLFWTNLIYDKQTATFGFFGIVVAVLAIYSILSKIDQK